LNVKKRPFFITLKMAIFMLRIRVSKHCPKSGFRKNPDRAIQGRSPYNPTSAQNAELSASAQSATPRSKEKLPENIPKQTGDLCQISEKYVMCLLTNFRLITLRAQRLAQPTPREITPA